MAAVVIMMSSAVTTEPLSSIRRAPALATLADRLTSHNRERFADMLHYPAKLPPQRFQAGRFDTGVLLLNGTMELSLCATSISVPGPTG